MGNSNTNENTAWELHADEAAAPVEAEAKPALRALESAPKETAKNDDVFKHLQSRILTHYPEARMILDKKMPPPRTAIVYPTYVCNQDCLWCEYSHENYNENTIMSNERLRQVIDELHDLGVQGVEFCGGGEPTLHPLLPELVRDMKNRGMSIGLLTNGTRLKGELASALVDCASYVRVGYDGATKETFEKVKRPKTSSAGYDAVCTNVRNMIALRAERGAGVQISIKVVLDQNNYHEIDECVALAVDLGVDSVQFKAARLVDSELNEAQCEEVNAALDAARERYPEMTVVGGTKKLNMTQKCWLTPLQVTIDTLGEVYLCCYYRHRKESHTIGNIFQNSLEEMWGAQGHWDAIDGIEPRECNNLDCRFVNYNAIMSELMIERDAQFEFI